MGLNSQKRPRYSDSFQKFQIGSVTLQIMKNSLRYDKSIINFQIKNYARRF
jgi:hypothetical protein